MATRKKLILAHSGKKNVYKRDVSCQDGWGQSEEVDATASSANTLETPAGDTATPPRREFFTVPLQVPDHILDWLRLGHVVIPSHLELSFYNGRAANLPPTLLK